MDLPENVVLGIDLGTAKSGVCWIKGNSIHQIETIRTAALATYLEQKSTSLPTPKVVVVDVPIDPTSASGYRLVDRAFMRGRFNNSVMGLSPNNPDFLNLEGSYLPIKLWFDKLHICYSNQFQFNCDNSLRETFPNAALGMLVPPSEYLAAKRRLRFRYGQGKNRKPVIVAFEALAGRDHEFFKPINGVPKTWEQLEAKSQDLRNEQSDDLIAATVCGCLAWWACNTDRVGFVSEERGHYLLPPREMLDRAWLKEIDTILCGAEFKNVKTNLVSHLSNDE